MATEIIKVKSNMPDKTQVALWERDPKHPKSEKFPDGGEVWVADDKEHEVALTTGVRNALRLEHIVKVETPVITSFKETAQEIVRGTKREKATE